MHSFISFSGKIYKELLRGSILALLSLIPIAAILGQKEDSTGTAVKGIVLSKHAPLPNITLLLQLARDSSFVKATLTDSTGSFDFPNVRAGNYLLSVQARGYQLYTSPVFAIDGLMPEKNLQPVTLDTIAVKSLSEVIVKARKPLIERKPGKIIFNIENSIVAVGSNAWDILKKTPSVRTTEQGSVTLRSNLPAAVMLNNKMVGLSGTGLVNLLSSINSEDIIRIEVIINPSAAYDAEGTGGLLNIVTRKNQQEGFSGTVSMGSEQTTYAKYNGGLTLNYKHKKLNCSLTDLYKNGEYLTREYLEQEYNIDGKITLYKEALDRYSKSSSNTPRLDLSYTLSKKSTIGVMVDGVIGSWGDRDKSITPIYNNKQHADSSFLSSIGINGHKNYLSLNTNYRGTFDSLGRTLNIDADYLQYNTVDHSLNTIDFLDVFQDAMRPTVIFRSAVPQAIRIYTAKLDYTHPVNASTSLSLGAKANKTNTDNLYTFENYIDKAYINDPGKSNHYNYEENIVAFYGSLTKTLKNFTFQAGLRTELTKTKGNSLTLGNVVNRHYTKLFPTLFLQQKFSDHYLLELVYGNRIDRPSYSDMNPFRYYSTPYSSAAGNPFLKPSYTHAFTLVNTFNNKYVASIFYIKNEDGISQVPVQNNEARTILFQQLNLQKNTMYGISLELPLEMGNWWQLYNSASIYRTQVYYPYLNSVFAEGKTTVTISSTQSFVLSPYWSAEVNAMYQSPGVSGLFHVGSYSAVAIGIKRKLLHDKAVISLNISDLFRGTIVPASVKYLDQSSLSRTDEDNRGIRLNFSYKFGRTKIKQNEARESGNKEEQTRIKK